MSNDKKVAFDCDSFYEEYMLKQKINSQEQFSFLVGYYVHLITDAAFQEYICDENRLMATWGG